MVGFSNENGNINYSDEVLGKIVGLATMECYGVVGMVSKNASEGFWELIRVEHLSKGVIAGVQYSHSHRQSKRTWAPNIKRVKALVNGTPKTVHACTRCLRSGKVQRAV